MSAVDRTRAEAAVQAAMPDRAQDFGDDITPGDVQVDLGDEPVADHWVFVASWGHSRFESGVAGIVTPSGEVVSLPNTALARVWQGLLDEGDVDPRQLATVAARLLGGPQRNRLLDQAPRLRGDSALTFRWERRHKILDTTLTLDRVTDTVTVEEVVH